LFDKTLLVAQSLNMGSEHSQVRSYVMGYLEFCVLPPHLLELLMSSLAALQ